MALAHPEFGSSVNPITTRGADYAHHITASPPGFETDFFVIFSKNIFVFLMVLFTSVIAWQGRLLFRLEFLSTLIAEESSIFNCEGFSKDVLLKQ